MSKAIEQAHDLAPGTAYVRATVTTAERVEFPAGSTNCFWAFHAEGTDVWIRFGDGTVTVDKATVSTMTGEEPAEAANGPHARVPADTTVHLRIAAGAWSHFAHISDATTGKLRFGPTTGTGTKDDA